MAGNGYSQASKSKEAWAQRLDSNINLIDPPIGCFNKDGTMVDFSSSRGNVNCPFGPGLDQKQGALSFDDAKSMCEQLGSSCQGVGFQGDLIRRTPSWQGWGDYQYCKTKVDDPFTDTSPDAQKKYTDLKCWAPYQSFARSGTCENQCPHLAPEQGTCPDGKGDCTRGASKYFMLKEGYAFKDTDGTTDGLWCLASITTIPKVINGNIEHVEIKDLKVGDIVQTTRGNMPISHIMKTNTIGYVHDNYVKVEKGALGKNFPSEDLYVTHEHSFSLGYYKNSLINRNIHDKDQDDMVYLHITADQLADKLPGITRVSKEFESAINLVFDEHTSINIYGLDVVTHHPKGNPYILPEEKYQDKSKFNSKIQKPLFANYDMLVHAKPEHMEMKDFLRGCITADLNNKLNLENVNNISFTPQKTMLTDDLRQKLKV